MVDVSVVICTVNRPVLLRRCIESCVAAQGTVDVGFEVIVIDNSQAGAWRTIVEDCAAAAPVPVRHVHESRGGISFARNAGVAASTAPFIAFIDDDEEVTPGWLAALWATAARGAADIVLGPVVPVPETAPLAACEAAAGRAVALGLPTGSVVPIAETGGFRGGGAGNCLIRRESWLCDPEPFDPAFNRTGGEDTDFFLRSQRRGARIVWCREALVFERTPDDRDRIGYRLSRRFRESQLFIRIRVRNSRHPRLTSAHLMARGLVQTLVSPAVLVIGRQRRGGWTEAGLQLAAGLGKLLWWVEIARHR